jgi:putative NADH-flavin reductase
MKLLVFGATGGTGHEIVAQGLDQGHVVTAFVRNLAAITTKHEKLKLAQGDVLDYPSVQAAVQVQDAVLSALGVRKLRKNTILSDGTKSIIRAMEQHGVKRFVCESSLGVGDSKGQLSRCSSATSSGTRKCRSNTSSRATWTGLSCDPAH